MKLTPQDLEYQTYLADRYGPIVAAVFWDTDLSDMTGNDLFYIAGPIQDDDFVFQRGLALTPAGTCVMPPTLEIVSGFSHEEKKALQARVCVQLGLKLF